MEEGGCPDFKIPTKWSEGQIVCMILLRNLRRAAYESGVGWGCRSSEVVAYGKLGCCCRTFREFLRDPIIKEMFDYELESMLMYWA